MKSISSIQNPFIKFVLQLQEKSRTRKKEGKFVVEGQRELSLAICGGYEIEQLLYCAELYHPAELKELPSQIPTVHIPPSLYEKIAHRGSTEGIMAVVKSKDHQLNTLQIKRENPLILIAEAPEKPGNIGALLRTADAANLDAVLIANPKTDLYNPNIIRSSVGCLFTNRIATGSTEEIIQFLKDHQIKSYCAALDNSISYTTPDYRNATAIVVGTEATGLSKSWLQSAEAIVKIPMQGVIDSLNVSVSAAIIIFEAKRQRNFS
ncbi:RNA methyltransferase [Flavobacteriaceae bacterium F08102]|nr:RNA methyltransferase [Flavobacteriaceae bacterium F08102]